MATGTSLRWRHSGAQLADCLTKGTEQAQKSMELLKRRNYTWKLVYDPDFVAAKKRRKDLDALADPNDFMNFIPNIENEDEPDILPDARNQDLVTEMSNI